MFDFIKNLFAGLASFTSQASADLPAVSQTATNILNLAAIAAPQHAAMISGITEVVQKDTDAAQSFVKLASDHVATMDSKSLFDVGITAISTINPAYAPFLMAAKPLIVASEPLVEQFASAVAAHFAIAASAPAPSAAVAEPEHVEHHNDGSDES